MHSRARTQTPEPRLDWRAKAGHVHAPLAWGLLSDKPGDNRQVEQLVEALGYDYEIKHFTFRPLQHLPNPMLGATEITVQSRGSAVLQAPWPDVVVSAGRRTAPVARAIRERSGGRSRLVHLGRPRASLDAFDLVVTTPQYGLPAHPHLVENTLPFQRPNPPDAATLEHWREEFESLPRPWIGVLVGGDSFPLRLTPEGAARLGEQVSEAALARGGSLLVTTSPRTGADQTAALFRALRAPSLRNDWHSDRPGCYPSILALADSFIVTADSVSMLAEACRTERPVEIAPLEHRSGPWGWLAERWTARGEVGGPVSALVHALARTGLLVPPRNVQRIADELIARGDVVPFDPTTPPAPAGSGSFRGEMEDTVSRIHALVDAAPEPSLPR